MSLKLERKNVKDKRKIYAFKNSVKKFKRFAYEINLENKKLSSLEERHLSKPK